jgi:hypothetical protein
MKLHKNWEIKGSESSVIRVIQAKVGLLLRILKHYIAILTIWYLRTLLNFMIIFAQ